MIPLLIAGHGTADAEGAAQFRQFVKRVAGHLEVPVTGGFIELSPPPLAEAVAALLREDSPRAAGPGGRGGGTRRLVAVPLMLVAAGHAKGDIPAALARERARHPGLSTVYGRPLGPHPAVLDLLRDRLAEAGGDGGTTVLLVGRGSTDPDANAEVAKMARLLAETTDVAGVEYAFVSLAAPDTAAGLERCLRLGARHVVVLPYFLFTGVLPRRVATHAHRWAATNQGVRVAVADVLGDCDVLARLVVERYHEALAGDIRMNCDTCLYRIALPGHDHRVGAAQTPHDHPQDHTHPH